MYTAVEINEFLKGELGTINTKMKRQKLLYFAQAWHLAWYGKPLFEDEIHAWKMGPVTVSVYHDEKIARPAKTVDLDESTVLHLQAILEFYGSKTGQELSNITHRDMPWKQAMSAKEKSFFVGDVIPKNSMFKFYALEKNAPKKPVSQSMDIEDDEFDRLLALTSTRLKGVDRILADR